MNFETLRSVVPRLNRAADAATLMAAKVDESLSGLNAGITVVLKPFHSCPTEREPGQGGEYTSSFALAYCRPEVGAYRVCVVETVTRPDGAAGAEVVSVTRTPWSSCQREIKLRASTSLPALMDAVGREAVRLCRLADEAAAELTLMGADRDARPE